MAPQHAVHTLHLLHGQVPLHQPLDVHLAQKLLGKICHLNNLMIF